MLANVLRKPMPQIFKEFQARTENGHAAVLDGNPSLVVFRGRAEMAGMSYCGLCEAKGDRKGQTGVRKNARNVRKYRGASSTKRYAGELWRRPP